ncbi:MAG: hypothetical protein AB1521_09400 [Bacteroidota bacterium]
MKEDKILFHEEEKFDQRWNLFLITPIASGMIIFQIVSFYYQFILKKPIGSDPLSDTEFIILFVITIPILLFVIWLFFVIKLTVKVDEQKIFVKFYPLMKKEFLLSEIESFEIKEFNPVIDFGGWGLRYSIRWRTTGYIMKGKVGVHIHFKNKKNILIGSQRANELYNIIKKAKSI